MLQEIRDICRTALEEGREPVIPDKWTCIPSKELLEMLFEDVKNENKYSISVRYTTGDSFDTYEREDEIPLLFSTLKEAQNFVATMFEFTAFADAGDSMFIDRKALAEAKEKKPWYNPRFDFVFMFNDQVVHAFWVGYFEELDEYTIYDKNKNIVEFGYYFKSDMVKKYCKEFFK